MYVLYTGEGFSKSPRKMNFMKYAWIKKMLQQNKFSIPFFPKILWCVCTYVTMLVYIIIVFISSVTSLADLNQKQK